MGLKIAMHHCGGFSSLPTMISVSDSSFWVLLPPRCWGRKHLRNSSSQALPFTPGLRIKIFDITRSRHDSHIAMHTRLRSLVQLLPTHDHFGLDLLVVFSCFTFVLPSLQRMPLSGLPLPCVSLHIIHHIIISWILCHPPGGMHCCPSTQHRAWQYGIGAT